MNPRLLVKQGFFVVLYMIKMKNNKVLVFPGVDYVFIYIYIVQVHIRTQIHHTNTLNAAGMYCVKCLQSSSKQKIKYKSSKDACEHLAQVIENKCF